MNEPSDSDADRKIKRYDLRNVDIFRRALVRKPWLGLLLFVLAVIAGAALALGWVGKSETRRSAGFRTWAGAALWWLFGAWIGAETWRAMRQRGQGEAPRGGGGGERKS